MSFWDIMERQRREKTFQLKYADDKRIKGYKLARKKIHAENQNKASILKRTETGTRSYSRQSPFHMVLVWHTPIHLPHSHFAAQTNVNIGRNMKQWAGRGSSMANALTIFTPAFLCRSNTVPTAPLLPRGMYPATQEKVQEAHTLKTALPVHTSSRFMPEGLDYHDGHVHIL